MGLDVKTSSVSVIINADHLTFVAVDVDYGGLFTRYVC